MDWRPEWTGKALQRFGLLSSGGEGKKQKTILPAERDKYSKQVKADVRN